MRKNRNIFDVDLTSKKEPTLMEVIKLWDTYQTLKLHRRVKNKKL